MSARKEIEKRLLQWAAGQAPPVPVAIEGSKFTKPLSGPYLEITFLAGNKKNRNLAADGVRESGYFQIDCYAPFGKGMGEAEALAESMGTLFPVLPKTGTVSIEEPLSWSGSYVEDTFVCVPVRARYRIET